MRGKPRGIKKTKVNLINFKKIMNSSRNIRGCTPMKNLGALNFV